MRILLHGTHLLPMDHDRQDVSTPATRCAAGIMVPTEQQCRRVGGLQPRADECRTFYGWPAAGTIECGAHRYPPNPPLGTLRVGLRGPVRRGGCDVAEGAVANSIEDPGGQASSEGGSSSTPSQRCGLLSTWPTMPGTCRAREREPHRIRPACWALGSSSYILSASIPTTGAPVPSRPFRA